MTTEPASWHAADDSLQRLAAGDVEPALAASLEAHVLGCAGCRAKVNALAFSDDLWGVWDHVRERVEAPRPGVVERLLRVIGVPAGTARLLAAVPALRGSWLLSVFVVSTAAVVTAGLSPRTAVTLFLVAAPLVPIASVALLFGGDADPSHELVVTTPYSTLRLLLLRTTVVLATCVPVLALGGLLLPGTAWLALSWLAPAAAASTVTLAVAQRVDMTTAAASVGVAWTCVAGAAGVRDPLVLTSVVTQTACLAAAVGCLAVLVVKRDRFDFLGGVS